MTDALDKARERGLKEFELVGAAVDLSKAVGIDEAIRLTGAAQELLEACEAVADAVRNSSDALELMTLMADGAIEKLRDAIAKARGES